MFKKNFHLLFFMFLMMGTFLTISSNSWIMSWLGLEINLMSMIPLILFKLNFNSTESAIKYFIPQAFASMILIILAVLENLKFSTFFNFTSSLIILIALALKSGMAPLHFWFPQIMMFLEWNICAIMLIWQKIAPLVLMSMFFFNKLTMFIIVCSSVVGAVGGINQLNIKLILTYSSIVHSAWLLTSVNWSVNLWIFYFIIYSSITISIIIVSALCMIESILQLNKTNFKNSYKLLLIFNVLSLAGLPPFSGFFAKLMVIFNTIKYMPLNLLMIMIMSSLLSLYYYLKLFFNFFMTSTLKEKLISPQIFNNYFNIIFFSILLNILIPFLFFML